MSRMRMVKPAFFKHADLYDAEVASGLPLRVAFAGLWTVADRRGVFQWSRNLKPDVLPYDPCDMLEVLAALERAGFVHRYEVGGRQYGLIPTLGQHQTFHHREHESPDPLPANAAPSPGPALGMPGCSPTDIGYRISESVNSPPLTREASVAEIELEAQTSEHWPDVAQFLSDRPVEIRAEWATELLRAMGPATGVLPADLARACRDAKLATPPVTSATGLRAFARRCRAERLAGETPPARAAPRQGRQSKQETGRAALAAWATTAPSPGPSDGK
jgi:hypothetical protein